MKANYAAALALLTWYLMMPSTAQQLDSSCSDLHSIFDYVASFVLRESKSNRIKRCYHEARVLNTKAPVSEWFQEGKFERLIDCQQEQLNVKNRPDKLVQYNGLFCQALPVSFHAYRTTT